VRLDQGVVLQLKVGVELSNAVEDIHEQPLAHPVPAPKIIDMWKPASLRLAFRCVRRARCVPCGTRMASGRRILSGRAGQKTSLGDAARSIFLSDAPQIALGDATGDALNPINFGV
jgi:hypothetical protein